MAAQAVDHNPNLTVLSPQEGPQCQFLSSAADIVIYGGAAGGGKSYGLLLEPLRHVENPLFTAVIFRRTNPQLTGPGGMWDEAGKIYPLIGGEAKKADMLYLFESGMRVFFRHMEHEKTKEEWQGTQIPLIAFDELTHFSESQFIYLMSRNRSDSGVPGYMRGTCNPDPESWVRTWIDWWIAGEDYPKEQQGFPIPERAGVIRWFIRINDDMIWADSKQELIDQHQQHPVTPENQIMPKSFTFIPSTVYDNKALLAKDPNYLANLKGLSKVEQARLLGGNWDIKPEAGSYYQREWVEPNYVNKIPAGSVGVRFWDRAATVPSQVTPDPDWTVGLLMYKTPVTYDGPRYIIADVQRDRKGPGGVRQMIKKTAKADGKNIRILIEQEPGASGKADAQAVAMEMTGLGYDCRKRSPSGDKMVRYMPFSAAAELGVVGMLRAKWNDTFHKENENCVFDDTGHDDQCDAASGSYNELSQQGDILPPFEMDLDFGKQNNPWASSGT